MFAEWKPEFPKIVRVYSRRGFQIKTDRVDKWTLARSLQQELDLAMNFHQMKTIKSLAV